MADEGSLTTEGASNMGHLVEDVHRGNFVAEKSLDGPRSQVVKEGSGEEVLVDSARSGESLVGTNVLKLSSVEAGDADPAEVVIDKDPEGDDEHESAIVRDHGCEGYSSEVAVLESSAGSDGKAIADLTLGQTDSSGETSLADGDAEAPTDRALDNNESEPVTAGESKELSPPAVETSSEGASGRKEEGLPVEGKERTEQNHLALVYDNTEPKNCSRGDHIGCDELISATTVPDEQDVGDCISGAKEISNTNDDKVTSSAGLTDATQQIEGVEIAGSPSDIAANGVSVDLAENVDDILVLDVPDLGDCDSREISSTRDNEGIPGAVLTDGTQQMEGVDSSESRVKIASTEESVDLAGTAPDVLVPDVPDVGECASDSKEIGSTHDDKSTPSALVADAIQKYEGVESAGSLLEISSNEKSLDLAGDGSDTLVPESGGAEHDDDSVNRETLVDGANIPALACTDMAFEEDVQANDVQRTTQTAEVSLDAQDHKLEWWSGGTCGVEDLKSADDSSLEPEGVLPISTDSEESSPSHSEGPQVMIDTKRESCNGDGNNVSPVVPAEDSLSGGAADEDTSVHEPEHESICNDDTGATTEDIAMSSPDVVLENSAIRGEAENTGIGSYETTPIVNTAATESYIQSGDGSPEDNASGIPNDLINPGDFEGHANSAPQDTKDSSEVPTADEGEIDANSGTIIIGADVMEGHTILQSPHCSDGDVEIIPVLDAAARDLSQTGFSGSSTSSLDSEGCAGPTQPISEVSRAYEVDLTSEEELKSESATPVSEEDMVVTKMEGAHMQTAPDVLMAQDVDHDEQADASGTLEHYNCEELDVPVPKAVENEGFISKCECFNLAEQPIVSLNHCDNNDEKLHKTALIANQNTNADMNNDEKENISQTPEQDLVGGSHQEPDRSVTEMLDAPSSSCKQDDDEALLNDHQNDHEATLPASTMSFTSNYEEECNLDAVSEEGATQASTGAADSRAMNESSICSPMQEQPADTVLVLDRLGLSTNDIGNNKENNPTIETVDRNFKNDRESMTQDGINLVLGSSSSKSTSSTGASELDDSASLSILSSVQEGLKVKLRVITNSNSSEALHAINKNGHEKENVQLKLAFPLSVVVWCSQPFTSIFGNHSKNPAI